MDENTFTIRPLLKQSLAQRIFRQPSEENAIIEVNNLLASVPIRAISSQDIAAIDQRYKTQVRTDFPLNLEEFYAVYLNHCLRDHRLDEGELQDLQHLKTLFGLSDKTVGFLHEQIGGNTYRKTYEAAVSDGILSTEEKRFLQALSQAVNLPENLTKKISLEVRNGLLREKLALASRDNRLSPEEEQELLTISKNLGIALPGVASRKQLERMKLYWALENLEIPEISIDLPLQKGEVGHYCATGVQWKKISGKNWSAPLPYQGLFTGNEIPVSTVYSGRYLEPVDKGSFYLTDKRLVFDGREKRTTIRLDKILRVKTYTDALEIVRESGKNPIFFFKEPEEPGILLDRLLRG